MSPSERDVYEARQRRKYTVVIENNLSKFTADVEKLMRDGWQCQGGIETTMLGGSVFYMQAVIKL
jgi:hypothetical protein